MKRAKALMTGLLFGVALVACDQDPVAEQQNDDSQLTLTPDSVVVRLSQSSPLNVTVRDGSGAIQNVPVSFASRDLSVATVNASGTISGVTVGSTYVVAARS